MKLTWYKLAQVDGEWWIIDGQALFADGDIGDLNHNAYVIQHCQQELLEQFNCGSSETNWEEGKSCIIEAVYNELIEYEDDDEKKYELRHEKESDPELFLLDHAEEAGIGHRELMIADGHAPGREDINGYAMEKLGWKRVAGHNITTQTLTSNDLREIAIGLWDAYDEQAEDEIFNIEVVGSRNVFWSVPYSAIESNDISQLMDYRQKIPA